MQGIEKAMKKKTLGGSVQEVFVPRSLSSRSRRRGRGAIASLVGVSALALGLLLLSGDELVLFSFSPTSSALLSVATYAASLAALTAAAYVALAVAFKEHADVVTLLTSTALSFVPLCLFGAALHFLYA